MTSKEFVKEKYPLSYCENYKTRDCFDKKGYWLCWSTYKEGKQRLSEGASESNAWKVAKQNIIELK